LGQVQRLGQGGHQRVGVVGGLPHGLGLLASLGLGAGAGGLFLGPGKGAGGLGGGGFFLGAAAGGLGAGVFLGQLVLQPALFFGRALLGKALFLGDAGGLGFGFGLTAGLFLLGLQRR